jgi:hypothetical protein
MTTRWFSYALKAKLPERLCLIIIGTEGQGEPNMPRLVAVATLVTLALMASSTTAQDIPRESLPRPQVAARGPEYNEVRGSDFIRYSLQITNWRE